MKTIALEKPEDWLDRPNYHHELIAKSDEIFGILGKYSLPRPPEGANYEDGKVPCGLNNCRQLHFEGYLIALQDGRETNIGKDCGAREFGVAWTDVHATYKAAERQRTLQAVLSNIVDERENLLAKAEGLESEILALQPRLRHIRQTLKQSTAVWQHCRQMEKNDGKVQREIKRSKFERKGKDDEVDIETVAIIRHLGVLFVDDAGIIQRLRANVLRWLRFDADTEIEAADEDMKKLKAVYTKVRTINDAMHEAGDFLAALHGFMETRNLIGLQAIDRHLLRKAEKSTALTQALQRLTLPLQTASS